MGVVAELPLEARLPLSSLHFGDADDLGGAECIEAVDEGEADVDFGGLAVRVFSSDALVERFQTTHLGLDPAPGVVSRPAVPEGPALVPGGALGFVSDLRSWAVFCPRPAILADRDKPASKALNHCLWEVR